MDKDNKKRLMLMQEVLEKYSDEEHPLTTAQIPSAEIGQTAADILLNRLDNPASPFLSVYMKTTPVYRQSTDASREL